ncbi:MAG TPA: 50S ribosomal protein L17 [Planctomycetota bacterium]|nr:50S ribosomal protein L17 [Planctomycetota bacterium]
MRHRKGGKQLSRTDAHRKAMLRNLVCGLFLVEPKEGAPRRVTTTVPKAKQARRLAERAVTLGKRGTLHARRQALSLLANKGVVKRLFEDLAPLYSDRNGGYTRVVRLPKFRVGDGTELCYLELVSEAPSTGQKPAEPVAPKVAQKPRGEPKEPGAGAAESEGETQRATEGGAGASQA